MNSFQFCWQGQKIHFYEVLLNTSGEQHFCGYSSLIKLKLCWQWIPQSNRYIDIPWGNVPFLEEKIFENIISFFFSHSYLVSYVIEFSVLFEISIFEWSFVLIFCVCCWIRTKIFGRKLLQKFSSIAMPLELIGKQICFSFGKQADTSVWLW